MYSREDILVDFGGTGYLVDAVVGNRFGGYQPAGEDGYIEIGIIQRDIENIETYNDLDEIIRVFEKRK